MNTCRPVFYAAATLAAFSGLGAPSIAQDQGLEQLATAPGRSGETYGTASTTNYVLQAYQFEPPLGAATNVSSNNFGSRFCTSPCGLYTAAMLPAGAVIVGVELEACDTDAAADVTVSLVRVPSLEGSLLNLGNAFTSGTPGCAFVTGAVSHTVDNETGTYQVRVSIGGSTLATRFQAVRLIYRLQVSPAPATATFPNDVPTTHPFFRFVEALAAAGISGGCGAGAYCPDTPVTRGQMAVFLATALGLHFPN